MLETCIYYLWCLFSNIHFLNSYAIFIILKFGPLVIINIYTLRYSIPGNIFSFLRAYIFSLMRELICSSSRPDLYDMTPLKEEIFTPLKRGIMYQLKIGHRGCYIINRYKSPLLRKKKTPILREKKSSRSTPLQDVFKTSSWRFCLPGI